MVGFGYSPVGSSHKEPPVVGASRLLLVAPTIYLVVERILDQIPPSMLHHWVNAITAWRRFMNKRGLMGRITMAQLLLSLPLLYVAIQATTLAIWDPTSHHALSHSGTLATYAMMCTFLTASKSHSIVSLITGLSFDKLVPFHTASALLTLYMACLHAIQIAYLHRGDNQTSHHHDHEHEHEHSDHDDEHDEEEIDRHEHDPDHYHHEHEHESDKDHDHDHGHEHQYYYHRMLHTDSIHAHLGTDPNFWKFLWDSRRNQSGCMVLTGLILLVSTSLFASVLRKTYFEAWLGTHILAIGMVIVYSMIHDNDLVIWLLIWWGLDLVARYGWMTQRRYPKQAQVKRICKNVTRISFPKSQEFSFQPGQFLQIAIPTVKPFQFHPFSIASIPEDDAVTMYVRALPGQAQWTRQLYSFVAKSSSSSSSSQDDDDDSHDDDDDIQKSSTSTLNVRMLIEGPYGSVPAILSNQYQYSMAVLICGGIGVTPCLSVGHSLIHNPPKSLHKLWFIWSVQDENMTKAILPPTKAVGTTIVENGNKAGLARGGEDEIELVEQTSGSLPDSSNGNSNNGIAGHAHDHEDTLAVDGTAKVPLELQTDIYVTQLPSKWEEKVDEDEDDDETLPGEYNVHHGRRPDVYAILQQIQTEAVREGWPRVFVMGSGPSSMLRELQIACQNSQLQNLQIDFEQEVFGYQ